jgi:hypothetical protein
MYAGNDPINYNDPTGLAKASKAIKNWISSEIKSMTNFKIPKDKKTFNKVYSQCLKNFKIWGKTYGNFSSLNNSVSKGRRGTGHLLARMLYGEGTGGGYHDSLLRLEILGFWQIVKNQRAHTKKTVRSDLEDKNRYYGLQTGIGLAPDTSSKRWQRSVIVGTMFQLSLGNRLIKPLLFTKDMRYWHNMKDWKDRLSADGKSIGFGPLTNLRYRKITARIGYAYTMFYSYKE